MKTHSQNHLVLVIFFLFTLITACEKSIDVKYASINNTSASQQEDARASRLLNCNNCLVTHTSTADGQFDIDFTYNKAGNPETISIAGFGTITAQYDKLFRLQKENYGNGTWADFKYKGLRDRLPDALYYYDPAFGGLNHIDSFKYDVKGELIERKTHYIYNNHIDDIVFTYTYSYHATGNVDYIDYSFPVFRNPNGTLVYQTNGVLANAVYDNKPNYMTGSPWTKFLLFNTSYERNAHFYLLFSKNNAVKYYTPEHIHLGETYTSTIEYNSKGFANVIQTVITFEPWNVIGNETITSSSTCDENATISKSAVSSK